MYNLAAPHFNMLRGDKAQIRGNIWRYSEGMAVQATTPGKGTERQAYSNATLFTVGIDRGYRTRQQIVGIERDNSFSTQF